MIRKMPDYMSYINKCKTRWMEYPTGVLITIPGPGGDLGRLE